VLFEEFDFRSTQCSGTRKIGDAPIVSTLTVLSVEILFGRPFPPLNVADNGKTVIDPCLDRRKHLISARSSSRMGCCVEGCDGLLWYTLQEMD